MPKTPGMTTTAPSGCKAWIEHLSRFPVPVLRSTCERIAYWHEREDEADAHVLADLILEDPLMCGLVLAGSSQRLSGRLATPVETVTGALLLTGVESFFRDFCALTDLETVLDGQPEALEGALTLVRRAHSAARLTAAFAIHRQDEDAELLQQAALLHDSIHLLVWCAAPQQALDMARRQVVDPNLRSVNVQRDVLGTDLACVTRGLMEIWQMPIALRELAGERQSSHGARTVALGVRIARHLESGWHNAALPDDFSDLGLLLNLPQHAAMTLVRRTWE